MLMEPLHDYQDQGADWLASRDRALLADEMGLGKSAQVIAACDRLALSRVLVVCPASARVHWAREFERWSFFSPAVRPVFAGDDALSPAAGVVVCSYDYASAFTDRLRHLAPWDLLVLDECHMLKGIDTRRTRAVLGRDGLVRYAARVWALSGTPVPNHPGELWPLLYTFGGTSLPYEAYVERYCTGYFNAHGFQVSGAKRDRLPELTEALGRLALRRRKADVLRELPPISFSDVTVTAGAVDVERLRPTSVAQEEFLARLNEERGRVARHLDRQDLAGLEALACSVATLRRFTGLQKVAPVIQLVREELALHLYDKLVIFAVHRDVIELLSVGLRNFQPAVLDGSARATERQDAVDRFRSDAGCRVFIGNILAAGTAINLTAAHHVLFAELDWVPGNNQQAAMRSHRIGQTSAVTVRFVALPESTDQRIVEALRRKAQETARILGDPSPAATPASLAFESERR